MATAAFVANVFFCAESGRAQAGATDTATFLLFAGTDLWRYGGFADGGLLWSPAGLDADGFTGIR